MSPAELAQIIRHATLQIIARHLMPRLRRPVNDNESAA